MLLIMECVNLGAAAVANLAAEKVAQTLRQSRLVETVEREREQHRFAV